MPYFRNIWFAVTIHCNISGDTNIPSIRKGSVTITGSIHNIYFARQQLLVRCDYLQSFLYNKNRFIWKSVFENRCWFWIIPIFKGCLPLVMMFEMPDNNDMIDEISIQKLQEKLDVNISIKPKQRQANKSVLIKAQVRIVKYISTLYRSRGFSWFDIVFLKIHLI